jgi:hypothetical protein
MKSMKSIGKKPPSTSTDLGQELRKIESQIEAVSTMLTSTELELGVSVRLSVELRELEAYIRGIRFAMGQAPPWEGAAVEAEA